jgi:hypothetical protein
LMINFSLDHRQNWYRNVLTMLSCTSCADIWWADFQRSDSLVRGRCTTNTTSSAVLDLYRNQAYLSPADFGTLFRSHWRKRAKIFVKHNWHFLRRSEGTRYERGTEIWASSWESWGYWRFSATKFSPHLALSSTDLRIRCHHSCTLLSTSYIYIYIITPAFAEFGR